MGQMRSNASFPSVLSSSKLSHHRGCLWGEMTRYRWNNRQMFRDPTQESPKCETKDSFVNLQGGSWRLWWLSGCSSKCNNCWAIPLSDPLLHQEEHLRKSGVNAFYLRTVPFTAGSSRCRAQCRKRTRNLVRDFAEGTLWWLCSWLWRQRDLTGSQLCPWEALFKQLHQSKSQFPLCRVGITIEPTSEH